jgi:hypothetical protein
LKEIVMERIEIKAPGAGGAPRKYGLLSHIHWLNGKVEGDQTRSASTTRWEGGITWEEAFWDEQAIGHAEAALQEWEGADDETKAYGELMGWSERDAKTLYRRVKTSTGRMSLAALRAHVAATVEVESQRYMENELYVGWGSNPGLATDGEVLTGGASNTWPSLPGAVALLEQEWSTHTGATPVLHVPLFAAYYFAECVGELFESIDGKLYTQIGTPVILGTGYTNLSDAGTSVASGYVSLHMSGEVFGYRSDVIQPPVDVDVEINDIEALTEQTFVLGTTHGTTLTAYGAVC